MALDAQPEGDRQAATADYYDDSAKVEAGGTDDEEGKTDSSKRHLFAARRTCAKRAQKARRSISRKDDTLSCAVQNDARSQQAGAQGGEPQHPQAPTTPSDGRSENQMQRNRHTDGPFSRVVGSPWDHRAVIR